MGLENDVRGLVRRMGISTTISTLWVCSVVKKVYVIFRGRTDVVFPLTLVLKVVYGRRGRVARLEEGNRGGTSGVRPVF